MGSAMVKITAAQQNGIMNPPTLVTVNLLTVKIDGRAAAVRQAARLLSTDEQKRAAGITAPPHYARFVTMRAALRQLLGRKLGLPAAQVPIRISPRGKPHLADHDLFFSISYRDGVGVIALGPRELGIDLELLANAPHIATAAALTFAADERAALELYTDARRRELLLQGWTRKESIVKAWGVGLSHPLHEIRTAPGAREAVNEYDGRRWVTRDIAARGRDYRIALTVDLPAGHTLRLRRQRAR